MSINPEGEWTTSKNIEYSRSYIEYIKKCFQKTNALSKAEKRQSVVLIRGLLKNSENEEYKDLIYIYNSLIRKEFYEDKISHIVTNIENVNINEYNIKNGDIIYTDEGDKLLVEHIEIKTKEDWEFIISK